MPSSPIPNPCSLQFPVSPLTVEAVRPAIFPVDFSEKSFEFLDLALSDVRPNFEDREMTPQTPLSSAIRVGDESPLYARSVTPGHAHVHDVVLVLLRKIPIQSVNSAQSPRHEHNFVFGNPLCTSANQS